MDLAMIGTGRMGLNMATRLHRQGHRIIAWDPDEAARHAAHERGLEVIPRMEDLRDHLAPPRHVWIMVPAGEPTETTIHHLCDILQPGDTIIDGGNSNYHDTEARAEFLAGLDLHLVDAGTSGGIWGLEEGYSLMVGGEPEIVDSLTPIFAALAPAPDRGWGHVGPPGAGHFVKMIHNGIEYGMMQSYAEGFAILEAKENLQLDLAAVTRIWQHGSVIRSWLLDLTATALEADPTLSSLEPWVADSGEGRWTVSEAIDLDIPAPVITLALQMRLASRQENSFAARLLAALRQQFGGHAVRKKS